MKKFGFGMAAAIGVISSLISISNALPQYTSLFIGCIGLSLGYFFGAFSPNVDKTEPMDSRTKQLILRIVLLATPFICLFLTIIIIHLIGLLDKEMLSNILVGGLIIMGLMYIIASIYIGINYADLLTKLNQLENKDHDIVS